MGELPTLGKFGGNFGRKGEMMEEEKKGKGEGKRGRKGTERQGNGEGNDRKIVVENLELKGERYENEQRIFFFFFFFFFCLFFSLFETTKICLGCTKMEILGENF